MVRLRFENYTVAWIAILPVEAAAARLVFDNEHDGQFPSTTSDDYIYIGGDLNGHQIVLATLPKGQNYGVGAAAALVNQVKIRFPKLQFALLVGVAAGLPNVSPKTPKTPRDIRLGDVIVSVPEKGSPGVVHYDLGTETENGFTSVGRVAETPQIVRAAIGDIELRKRRPFKYGNIFSTYLKELQEKAIREEMEEDFSCPSQDKDQLYESVNHGDGFVQQRVSRQLRDESDRTRIWYGTLGSGNSLMRNSHRRDLLRDEYNLIGLDMEAAGVMNSMPAGVIRGVCDYGDAQKNKEWQPYAAAVAAIYAKGVLNTISPINTGACEGIKGNHSTALFDQPRPRDVNFVGRVDIIDNIDDKFKTGRHVALTGIGGVGFRERNPEGCVFWIFASTSAGVAEAYKHIARQLKLSGCEDPDTNVLQLVYDWLSCDDHNDWLLILDNVDDEDVFSPVLSSNVLSNGAASKPDTLDLSRYLPRTRGSILITSRNRKAAFQLTNSAEQIINVPRMDQNDAKALLQKKLPFDKSDGGDKTALVEALEFLPLAITQAAAYISVKNTRMTVSKYVKLFQQNAENQTKLLQDDMRDLRRDSRVPNSVIETWQISFEQIKRTSPKSADLLSLMSVLDRQGIPDFLFCNDGNRLDFENIVAPLLDFSLISSDIDGEIFQMHRLVQLATRTWLKLHREIEKFNGEGLSLIARFFPSGNYANWKTCAALFQHAEIVVGYEFSDESNILLQAGILLNLAQYILEYHGNYTLAQRKSQTSLDHGLRFLAPDNPTILGGLTLHAKILRVQGKYEEAEAMDRQTLATRERTLGPEHPDTQTSMSNLALELSLQGKYTESEALNRQTLATRERTLGLEHPDTQISMSNLALVLSLQGKYTESEAMDRQTLASRERTLGPEHPSTLTSMSNLAIVLSLQGNDTESEALNRQTIATRERTLGPEHSDTQTSISNLAIVLSLQGNNTESEALNRQILATRERTLGLEHPNTLTSMSNLALVLLSQGKYTESEALNRQTLATRERTLGPEHPDTHTSMSNLAIALSLQGQYAESEALTRQTLATRKRTLGPEHPSTLTSMSNLALVLCSQGKYAESEALNLQTLATRERTLGPEHPDTQISMKNLALVLSLQGKYTESEALNRQMLATRERTLGPVHPDTQMSIRNLAIVLSSQGKYSESGAANRRILAPTESTIEPEHDWA